MSKSCKSCGAEKLTEKDRVLNHLRDVMGDGGKRGGPTFYHTLQSLEPSDYYHQDTTDPKAEAITEACREYNEAIRAAFTAFGKVLVAAGRRSRSWSWTKVSSPVFRRP